PRFAMPSANSAYRPEWSPRPWTTAKVMVAPAVGQARYASRVPSVETTVPSAVSALSVAKVSKAPQDLERLLFGLQQSRRIGADAVEGVRPLGPRRSLRV